jgi:hypothetical protein
MSNGGLVISGTQHTGPSLNALAQQGGYNQGQPAPPLRTPFQEALVKVGMPRVDIYNSMANGDVVLSVKEHMAETVKWHRAMIKIYEFMEAQLNIDLFKDDPEAKAIYTSWISKGLMALRDEAGAGVLR